MWPTLDKFDRMAKLEEGAQELLNLDEKPDLVNQCACYDVIRPLCLNVFLWIRRF